MGSISIYAHSSSSPSSSPHYYYDDEASGMYEQDGIYSYGYGHSYSYGYSYSYSYEYLFEFSEACTADFAAFDEQLEELKEKGVRITGVESTTVSQVNVLAYTPRTEYDPMLHVDHGISAHL